MAEEFGEELTRQLTSEAQKHIARGLMKIENDHLSDSDNVTGKRLDDADSSLYAVADTVSFSMLDHLPDHPKRNA